MPPKTKKAKISIEKPTLYSYWRSSCSWRVRIVLALKEIEYEYVAVNLLAGQQKEESYVAKNPSKVVPALQIEGQILAQSLAIIEYLEEQFQKTPVLPEDSLDRAVVRQMAHILGSDTQPVQNLRVLDKIEEKTKDKEYRTEWARFWIEEGLTAFNKVVAKHGGKYCFGDSVTLADVMLVPQLYGARRQNCDLKPFAKLVEIESRLAELPAFKAAHPDQQPDCPDQLAKKKDDKKEESKSETK